tara:strand:+ start:119462 stop:122122 length:2661 start_codon:yes stop_codon:yes gene_type:complete
MGRHYARKVMRGKVPAMSRSLLWRAVLTLALPAAMASDASAQRPTASVVSKVDVNGDTRPDEVRIDEDGSITVHITGDDDAGAWTPLAATGKVVGGSIVVDSKLDTGRTIILATSKLGRRGGRSFTEAVALAWTPGRLETLWRGKLGTQGADGATSLSIELGTYGLIKYSNRLGVSRCDGEAAQLDAERYDFATSRFRPARQALRMAEADSQPHIVASRKAPDFVPANAAAFWFRATGSSSSSLANSAAELVAPIAIADGSDTTAWVENKGGTGTGEFATLQSSVGDVHVRALRLALGHGAAAKSYNRPKRIGIILSASEKYWVDVPKDPREAQWVVLPKPVVTSCVTVLLDSVYPKRPLAQTAISEVTVFSAEELDPAKAAERLAERLAAGNSAADTQRLLSRFGPGASAALVKAIAKSKQRGDAATQGEVKNLRLALASIPAAPLQLVAGLADEKLSSREHNVFSAALLALQEPAIAPLAVALLSGTLSSESTNRVASVLSALPQAQASEALLNATGNGSEAVRVHIVHALANRPDAWQQLPAAVSPENTDTTQADLIRAMGLAAERLAVGSPERAALSTSVASAANAESLGYEEHYRALQAAGYVGGAAAIGALLSNIETLSSRKDAEGLALLRRALTSLGRATEDAAPTDLADKVAQAIRAALVHNDPGARLALLAALGTKVAPPLSVEERLRDDTWPEVRRAAAASLSIRCDAQSGAALRTAALEDASAMVARSAFGGLLRCKGPGNFDIAMDLVNNSKRPLSLRLQAARALGELATPSQAKAVIALFSKNRRKALASRTSGKVASALSRALADLGTPAAIRALESSAADPAFPQLQAAAITALGELCPATSKQLFERLRNGHEHTVSSAATMAARQCSSR